MTEKLTDRERRVLVYMSLDVPEDYGCYMTAIRASEVIEPANVRRVVRALARKGMVRLTPLFRPDDWQVAGSGYVVTKKGRDEANRIAGEVVL